MMMMMMMMMLASRTKEDWKHAHPRQLILSFSNGLMSSYGHKASQSRGRGTTGLGLLFFRPLQMTPTLNKTYLHTRSVLCIPSKKEPQWEEQQQCKHRRQPVLQLHLMRGQECSQRGWSKSFKGRLKKIGNALMKLCFCFPLERNFTWGRTESPPRNRAQGESPEKKWQAGPRYQD